MKVIIEIEPELFNSVVTRTQENDYMSDVWLAVGHGIPYEERPQGAWRHRIDTQWPFECNICKGLSPYRSPYCGVCGAKMKRSIEDA